MTATIADDALSTARTSKTAGVVDQLLADAPRLIIDIPLEQILDHPDNPRSELGDLTDLAVSIRQVGIIESLTVTTAAAFNAARGDGEPQVALRADVDLYVCVAGHRRKAAAAEAGETTAPCVVRDDLVGAEGLAAMLIENLQREDLTALDEAAGFQQLRELKWTQAQISARVGVSQPVVSKRLSLNKLPAGIKSRIDMPPVQGGVTLEQAEHIARLPRPVADRIADSLATHPRLFDARTVAGVISTAVEAHERDTQRTAALTRLREAGITVLNGDGDTITELDGLSYSRTDGPCPLNWIYTGGDREQLMLDHVPLPCHAAVITENRVGYSETDPAENWITYICTDPASHQPATTTPTDTADAETSDDSAAENVRAELEAHRAAIAEVNDRRKAFMRSLLTTGKPSKADTAHVIRGAALDALVGYVADGDRANLAADLISYDTETWLEPVTADLDQDDDQLTDEVWRFTFAGRLADDDFTVRAYLGRDQISLAESEAMAACRVHLAFLASAGYDLDPLEQQLLDDTRFTVHQACTYAGLDGLTPQDDEMAVPPDTDEPEEPRS